MPRPIRPSFNIRGLDGYIWAEGYIIRGPTAGTFTSVDIPYSAHHHQQFSKKIYDGPYHHIVPDGPLADTGPCHAYPQWVLPRADVFLLFRAVSGKIA